MYVASKHFRIILTPLFWVVFLVSCQTIPPETSTSTADILPTTTPRPTKTPSPSPANHIASTPTLSPTNHITLTLTLSPTQNLSPTATYIPYPEAPPLVDFLISKDDILSPEVRDWDFIYGIIDSFLNEGSIYINDRSYETEKDCPIECTKQSWTESLGERVHRHLEITMVRMKNELEASDKASELFMSLSPYHYEYGIDEYKWINAPTQNSHIGFSDWNRAYVLTTSRGAIAIMIVSHPSPYSDDGLYEVSLMVGFANVQFYKLKNANLIP